jgi:hypothetical protein
LIAYSWSGAAGSIDVREVVVVCFGFFLFEVGVGAVVEGGDEGKVRLGEREFRNDAIAQDGSGFGRSRDLHDVVDVDVIVGQEAADIVCEWASRGAYAFAGTALGPKGAGNGVAALAQGIESHEKAVAESEAVDHGVFPFGFRVQVLGRV